jgi:hypothetical protein
MNFNVFIPLIFALSSSLAVLTFVRQPNLIWWVLGSFVILSLATAWSFCRQAKNYFGWWQFALLPVLANLTTILYLVIVADKFLIYILAIFLMIFNYIYWRYLYFYLNNPSRYQSFSLEFLSFYLSFVLVFLAAAGFFGLKFLLNLNSWLVIGVAAVYLSLIIYQFTWISKYDYKKAWIYLGLMWLMLVELFAVLLYLPLHYNVLAFTFSIGYYLLAVIINDQLKNKLDAARLKLYIIISVLVTVAVLASARWI